MAQLDKIKEEIGWLKLVFGLLAAIQASLVGWMAHSLVGWVVQEPSEVPIWLLWSAFTLFVYLTTFLIFIALSVRRKIGELGELE